MPKRKGEEVRASEIAQHGLCGKPTAVCSKSPENILTAVHENTAAVFQERAGCCTNGVARVVKSLLAFVCMHLGYRHIWDIGNSRSSYLRTRLVASPAPAVPAIREAVVSSF